MPNQDQDQALGPVLEDTAAVERQLGCAEDKAQVERLRLPSGVGRRKASFRGPRRRRTCWARRRRAAISCRLGGLGSRGRHLESSVGCRFPDSSRQTLELLWAGGAETLTWAAKDNPVS